MAASDHSIITNATEAVRTMFSGGFPEAAPMEIDFIKSVFTAKLPAHFADEEDRLFPRILAGKPSKEVAQLIMDLKEDHRRLLIEARALNWELCCRNLMPRTNQLHTDCLDFLADLEKHVSKEDELYRLLSE